MNKSTAAMTIKMKKHSRSMTQPRYKIGFTDTNDGGHHVGYKCRICKKRFDTFQALGGHQGTHKKAKLKDSSDACLSNLDIDIHKFSGLHRCKTCMKGFATGQALGGHMSRHRFEKALILVEVERLWRQQVAEKAESDLVSVAVGLQRLKAEEDKRHEVKSELILAAKEWRLSV